MAKLSARGRTMVYEITKTVPSTNTPEEVAQGAPATWSYTRRLMSDGVVLSKCGNRWTVQATLKPGVNPADWLKTKLANGWKQV